MKYKINGSNAQQISPWFPTVPAIACSTGLFSFNINGVPEKDANVPIGYDNNNNLLALQSTAKQ